MKIRIMGLPAEVERTIEALHDTPDLDLAEVSGPYPNWGASRMVRVYIEAQLSDGQHGTGDQRSYAAIHDTWGER